MNRQEILQLETANTYPAISIFMPTVRNYPENRQNKINIKNLVARVKQQLNGEFDKSRKDEIMNRVEKAIEGIDFEHPESGLAVFINDDVSYVYTLPFPVKERFIIDKTFETRDLVSAYSRNNLYYVIVLDEKLIRIFYGSLQRLTEAKHPKLPVQSLMTQIKQDFDPQTRNIGGRGTENEGKLKNCFREADHVLKEFINTEKIPFIITGSEKEIALYKELTQMPSLILGTVNGSYEKLSVSELAAHVWPAAKEGFLKEQELVLLEADKAAGAKKFAAGIEEVWQAAKEGRGMKLLVETGYSYTAKPDHNGMWIVPSEAAAGEGILSDAVDAVIETVIAKDGKVVFFDDGMLESYGHIAMILRY
jgi:hypothetical protein